MKMLLEVKRPDSVPGRSNLLQRKCDKCKKGKHLQRRSEGQARSTDVLPIVHEVLRSSGQPMDRETRAFMETRFGYGFSNVRVHSATPQAESSSLGISSSGDIYEHEADQVADRIVNTSSAQSRRNSSPGIVHDFSKVRVYTGSKAAESARAVGANAYTIGQYIVFGDGQYKPATIEGRKLLAHEITHVLQQTGKLSMGLIQRQKCSNISRIKAIAAATFAENNLFGHRSGTEADPYIWFDDWGKDGRDNNNWDPKTDKMKKEVKIDKNDPEEANLKEDGTHLHKYKKVYPTYVCSDESKRADECDPKSCSYNWQNEFVCHAIFKKMVRYMTCIDIPTRSFGMTGNKFPIKMTDDSRDIKTVEAMLGYGNYSDWQVLRRKGVDLTKDVVLMPGDFVSQYSHHSGIVGLDNIIIHLPGPSTLIGAPSSTNDVIKDDYFINPTYIARPPGQCIKKRLRPFHKGFAGSYGNISGSLVDDCPCNDIPPGDFPQTEEIYFLKDRPQPWYDSISSFKVSVTEESKAKFNEIVSLLKTKAELLAQLEGHASSEKPANDNGYNFRLADRRTRLIAQELIKRDIDPNRIQDPLGQSCSSGCQEIGPGLHSCGDIGSNPSVDEKDRKVVINIFKN